MKVVVFIGNRVNTLKILMEDSENFLLIKIFALKNSLLHNYCKEQSLEHELFEINPYDKEYILNYIVNESFDILISNGCPFILPIEKIKKNNPSIIAINTHPTYLPHLKGKTPLNGVFMLNYNFIGATTHYINEGIDTGNIIYQKKIYITKDLDQGLIYMISFDLETIVFKKAMEILISKKFNYPGKLQKGKGSYFNRDKKNMDVNFNIDSTNTIVKKINSVGIVEMGVEILINNEIYVLHNAEPIINSFILNKYKTFAQGDILYSYSDKFLIKTIDGIVKTAFIKK